MKLGTHRGDEFQPQMIDERKPLRPVYVTLTQRPIKVTKPMSLGGETLPVCRTRLAVPQPLPARPAAATKRDGHRVTARRTKPMSLGGETLPVCRTRLAVPQPLPARPAAATKRDGHRVTARRSRAVLTHRSFHFLQEIRRPWSNEPDGK